MIRGSLMYKKLTLAIATTGLLTILNPSSSLADGLLDTFAMPSRNIYCGLIEVNSQKFLRCEIRSSLNPLPPQPYEGFCQFDWGAGLLLPESGKPRVLCISDTIASNDDILAYGNSWHNDGFTCRSNRNGLTCTNHNGNGFFLSRERWYTF